MTHFRVMESGDFIECIDDFDAEPWQAIGDIVRELVRGLLAEAGGRESAARGTGEVVGAPRAQPDRRGRAPAGEGNDDGGGHRRGGP